MAARGMSLGNCSVAGWQWHGGRRGMPTRGLWPPAVRMARRTRRDLTVRLARPRWRHRGSSNSRAAAAAPTADLPRTLETPALMLVEAASGEQAVGVATAAPAAAAVAAMAPADAGRAASARWGAAAASAVGASVGGGLPGVQWSMGLGWRAANEAAGEGRLGVGGGAAAECALANGGSAPPHSLYPHLCANSLSSTDILRQACATGHVAAVSQTTVA
jgi:hypothetical protein